LQDVVGAQIGFCPVKTEKETAGRGVCAIIPTYNNAGTLADVVKRTLVYCPDVIVVDDGSTDDTARVLVGFGDRITVCTHKSNRGKGQALLTGFRQAAKAGMAAVVTLDSDGQHDPGDIPLLVARHMESPSAIIVGSRDIQARNMPGKNTFANRFSNFWFRLQTGVALPDTQTGFRLYPLKAIYGGRFLTSRYEAELELLVLASWHGVEILPCPVQVYYPPEGERVTHFRPFMDFARISVLNTVLCFLAVVYGMPLRAGRWFSGLLSKKTGGNGK